MSTYSIIKRGVIQLVATDTSPKEIALPSAVRSATALLVPGPVKERRRGISRQHVTISITDADVSGTKDSAALGTAVDTASAMIENVTIREKRTDDYRGATVKLQSSTVVRATFNPLSAGDTIDIECDVVEFKSYKGAILRVKDDENLEALFDGGPLQDGETIDLAYNLIDFDDVINAILELDFKALRTLGYLGENEILDKVTRETPGNQVTYRLRLFNSKANAENATIGFTGSDFETGEIARVDRTIDIDAKNNDRESMIRVLSKLADTPGLTEE